MTKRQPYDAATPFYPEKRKIKMSETKFAKGPYSLMLGMPTNVLGPDGCRLARCDFDGDFNHPEAHANAKLFSAAWDMHVALVEARKWLAADDAFQADYPEDWEALINKIDAALAKARGETP